MVPIWAARRNTKQTEIKRAKRKQSERLKHVMDVIVIRDRDDIHDDDDVDEHVQQQQAQQTVDPTQ